MDTLQDNGIGKVIGTSVGNNSIGATTYTPMKLPKNSDIGASCSGEVARWQYQIDTGINLAFYEPTSALVIKLLSIFSKCSFDP